jgi:hypothetical protein
MAGRDNCAHLAGLTGRALADEASWMSVSRGGTKDVKRQTTALRVMTSVNQRALSFGVRFWVL